MTDQPLSPAAQAMLDAYWEAFNAPLEGVVHRPLAAALRVAADGCSSDWMGITVIHHLYALADELEGH